jgi:hypothetical protein
MSVLATWFLSGISTLGVVISFEKELQNSDDFDAWGAFFEFHSFFDMGVV